MTQQEKIKKAEALYESLAKKTEELKTAYHEAEGAYKFVTKHFGEYGATYKLAIVARDEMNAVHKEYVYYIRARGRAYCLTQDLKYSKTKR